MLTVHRATRADLLVDRLGDLLATVSDDVMAPEWVAVHSRGVERWISQQLAARLGATAGDTDGVAANVWFPFPRTVVDRVVDGVLGPLGPRNPWAPRRLALTLLQLLDDGDVSTTDLGAFGRHLDGDAHRRVPALRHAAALLDRYHQHRPDLVAAWVEWPGDGDVPDGRGGTVPDRLAWQAVLLRAARARLGPTPAERLSTAASRLDEDPSVLDGVVPERLSLFSLTALADAHVRVLAALAAHREVHAFLLHPSPASWERHRALAAAQPGPGRPRTRRSALPADDSGNALLHRWGRDSRELQLVLADRAEDEALDPTEEAADPTLLGRIQQDVRADRRGDAVPAARLDPDDRSLQVHAAHGRTRQVEVARDAVLDALADLPDLEPRDVVVMTPDVETYAPLVDAAFRAAADGASGIPDLRVRLADRSLRSTNPLLATVARLLELVDSRLEAGQVVDLLRRQAVRDRFALDDDEVDDVETWVRDVGVRWGLDLAHRRRHGLTTDANTWRFGLDRVLAGVAVRDGVLAGLQVVDAAPLQPRVVGAVATFVERLGQAVARLDVDHELGGGVPLATWVERIRESVDELTSIDESEVWQRWQLDRVLDELAADAQDVSAPVGLREVRGLLADALGGRPTRADHQTGDLTVCTLVPMRTVPFRVVVVVGLDDGDFPRSRVLSGDDVTGLEPLVGDRDPRTEDRQLLLDALMAAEDRFVVTYRGASIATNEEVPPSVVVSELLDAVDECAVADDGTRASDAVRHRHPLRAADPRAFRGPRPRWDRVALAGAAALAAGPKPTTTIAQAPPTHAITPPEVVTIEDVLQVLLSPARAYLRHVLGYREHVWGDARDDNLAVEARGLDGWRLGHALLDALDHGADPAGAVTELRRSGRLPVGRLGDHAVAEHLPLATTIALVREELAGPVSDESSTVEVDLPLGPGRLLGTVTRGPDRTIVATSYSSYKPGSLLRGWLQALAATAAGHPTTHVHVTKSDSGAASRRVSSHVVEVTDPDLARATLADLVTIARHAMTHPIPFFPNTSGAYWEAVLEAPDADASKHLHKAHDQWRKGFPEQWGEGAGADVLAVFGDAPLADLVDDGALPRTDDLPDWWDDAPHELSRWARWVYDPLRAAARLEHHPLHDEGGPT